jgi:hypothetical protein
VLTSVELADPQPVVERIHAYLDGRAELTGLDLYYELERSTSLLEFHAMLRGGPRNRTADGLQQSYGDHNRLLMHGLDRLVAGDVEWLRTRVDPDDPVPVDALVRCVRAVADLDLTREHLVALWLGAALHDCGMLCGRGALVDVEDGVVLSRPVIDAMCPPPHRDLATFVLHHHDYVKGVFLGEVPAWLVAGDLASLPVASRPVGLAGLGLVQVAGAASLGRGRLGAFRLAIFDRCIDGTAFDDQSASTRWRRLLAVDDDDRWPATAALEHFVERVAVHGWARVAAALSPDDRVVALAALAARHAGSGADHVVFADGCLPWSSPPTADRIEGRTETAASGVSVLVVEHGAPAR